MNSELWNNWNFGAAPLSLFLILCLALFSFPWLSPLLLLPTPPISELLLCWKDTFPDVITKSKCCSANRCCERPNMWIQWHKLTSWLWENMNHTFAQSVKPPLSYCSLKWWQRETTLQMEHTCKLLMTRGREVSHTRALLVRVSKDSWPFKQMVSSD